MTIYKFGKKSQSVIESCDQQIQDVMQEALGLGLIDMTAVYGHRTPEQQFELFKKGRKEVNGVWVIEDKLQVVTYKDGFKKLSEHNYYPSHAIDIFPFVAGTVSYREWHCIFMAGVIMAAAKNVGAGLVWGGNWDNDGEPMTDQTFQDLGHFQIIT